MHFETLKIFCDVVRYHSFSRGGSANEVSQSAASQAIQQLEKSLVVDLIDRSKRPWVLTQEGKFFFDGCQDILERYRELEEAVRRRQSESNITVRVAAIYSVGLHDMGHYVETFRASVPGAQVDLAYMHPDRVYESVLSDQADLGLISFAHSGQELTTVPWRTEPMLFTCLPSHPLARTKSLRPQDLNGERLVAFQKGLPIRREVDRFLKKHGVQVELVAEFDNIATIKQAVEEGTGVAILPEPTVRRDVERQALTVIPFAGRPFVRPLSIIHRRKRKLNTAVTRFMNLLRQGDGSASPSGQNGGIVGGGIVNGGVVGGRARGGGAKDRASKESTGRHNGG